MKYTNPIRTDSTQQGYSNTSYQIISRSSLNTKPPLYIQGVLELQCFPSEMRHPRRPTCRDDFEIAVICALPLEYDAVAAVLDGYWNNDGDIYGKVRGDQNTYTTGWINQHNVVLVLLPNIGKVNATSVARSCSLSFTQVKLAFLVGVCGAVPQTKNGIEIVLGDVVIAEQILEYDLGRRYSDGLQPKENLVRRFTEQNRSIRGYMATMQTERYRSILPERAGKYLKIAQECHPAKYDPPQQEEDKLYSSLYRHKHHAFAGCDICNKCATTSDPVCDTALNSTCEQLGCDDEMLVQRKQTGNSSDTWWPVVHWGTVASADTVMKSAVDRDTIARKYDIIGFEMEGAGTCDSFPCIVIKGACDYADSHKNKKWQNYAAITAACVMKALLTWYSKADSRTEDSSSTTVATNEQLMVSSTQVHHSAR